MTTNRDNLDGGICRRGKEVDKMEELTTAETILSFLSAHTLPDIFMGLAGCLVFYKAKS